MLVLATILAKPAEDFLHTLASITHAEVPTRNGASVLSELEMVSC